MKKLILTVIICLCFAMPALAEEKDYSYLDDMTINELKALDAEIHKRLPANTDTNVAAAYVTINNDAESINDPTENIDEPITVMDNEYVKVTFTGKYIDSDDPVSPKEIGYHIIVENKTDKFVKLMKMNPSIDGFMLDFQAGPYTSFGAIAPSSKANGDFYIPLDGRVLGVQLDSLDDLKNFNCSFQIQLSDDGASYSSKNMITVPFDCIVP